MNYNNILMTATFIPVFIFTELDTMDKDMYFYFCIYFGSNFLFTSNPGLNLPKQATINYNNVL